MENSPKPHDGNVYELEEYRKFKLSPQVRRHWEQTLEDAERLRENALRKLGRIGLERGLDGWDEGQ